MKNKNEPLETNNNLCQAIIKLGFQFDPKEQQWLHKHDDYCLVLQPYFRLCCVQYKKTIINMIRNTVVIAFNGRRLTSNSNQFDKLHKLLLTEFVFRQLQPDDAQEHPTDLSNDIIRNVYFIIDDTVINMREDWIYLYVYLLRLSGIMEEAKKDIALKTQRSMDNITMAVKLSNRKFVLRVVKLAQKYIFNIFNLIFLVSLVVFVNITQNGFSPKKKQKQTNIFSYFKSLERHLFIGDPSSVTFQHKKESKLTFLDSKLILETVNCFKLSSFDLVNSQPSQIIRIIQSYFDLEYTQEDSQLYINRFMYLIKAEFNQLKPNDSPIGALFGGKDENQKNILSTGEIISTMICLCVQSGLSSQNIQLYNQSLKSLLNFFLWFLLLCSRDGLRQEQHSERNEELPKIIASNVLHFLFSILQNNSQEYMIALENTLHQIFVFLGLLIRCLSQKLGNPQNFQTGIHKSSLMKNVEQYNFFIFQLLKQVLAIKDLKNIPDISCAKVIQLLHHPKVSGYFRNKLSSSIQSKINEAINNHVKNVHDIRKEVEYFFSQKKSIDADIKNEHLLINPEEFKRQFISSHLKKNNLDYRRVQRIWIKIWKRLRHYHYFWSVSMNQREVVETTFQKNNLLAYRHKFSKFMDANGVRPVLQIQHIEPWHVKKVLMQKQFEYRNQNYLYHLHEQVQHKKKNKSFLQKLMKTHVFQTMFYVDWIKHNSKRKGYLSVQNQKLKFKYLSTFQKDSHLEFTSFILAEYKPMEKYWPLVEITNIMERRYLTKRECLLIQFQDGTSLIFNFINQEKEQFMKLISARQQNMERHAMTRLNKITFYTKSFPINSKQALEEATVLWRQHKMSNFKYLMIVNKYAGRSYLDPANYPVFPWIVSDYNSQGYGYRDLSKTVGALGSEQRIKTFQSKTENTDPFDPVPPYQFGTHYSSPGVVFNFLIRLQPYTEASRTLQGGKFDLPDRLFSSIKVCWNSVTTQLSDVRQLFPEAYYLPEYLLNIDQYDFGVTQKKQIIHNVQVPEWATDAYDYIVKNRRQLQSDYVSENIGNWIDLIFGYKQKGQIAEDNLNLFFYLTYEDAIELNEIEDENTRISKEAQIMHFGQTPSQLWSKPHGGRPKAKRFNFSLKKISLIFSLQSMGPLSIIGVKDNKLVLFHDYNVLICYHKDTFHIQKQVRILRNNSRQNIYFLEDIEFNKRVKIFNNHKYIAVASYINGDLLVFSLPEGRKVEEKKGSAKLCIHVNQREDLMLVGSANGLLEVYQIVYGEKDALTLIKIASEYYMAPIHSISEGGNFFCLSSGSLIILIRASRSLNYIYDKFKMRGVKMIRALQIPRKVEDCIISTDPLFCFVAHTALELYSYSGNGQLLATKQADLSFPPVKFTQNFMDYLAYVQNTRLRIVSLPFLTDVRDLQLPNKKFIEMRFHDNKLLFVTSFGEILTLSQDHES